MITEEWKNIPDSDDAEVSNTGRIRRHGIICKLHYDSEGYARVTVGGKRGRDRVHRFVAEAFCPRVAGKDYVNHKNKKKHDNKFTNLEWSTNRENLLLSREAFSHENRVTPVLIMKGEITKLFVSQSEAAKFIGCGTSEINKVLRGKRKTCHGYSIEYLNETDAIKAIDASTGQMRLDL